MPDIVEQDDPEIALEIAVDRFPHRLVAAEAMREHHGPLARTGQLDVVAAQDGAWVDGHYARVTD